MKYNLKNKRKRTTCNCLFSREKASFLGAAAGRGGGAGGTRQWQFIRSRVAASVTDVSLEGRWELDDEGDQAGEISPDLGDTEILWDPVHTRELETLELDTKMLTNRRVVVTMAGFAAVLIEFLNK